MKSFRKGIAAVVGAVLTAIGFSDPTLVAAVTAALVVWLGND